MTDQLLQANLKAAELLGYDAVKVESDEGTSVHKYEINCDLPPFSIANPSDRDAVVQMLLDKGYTIIKYQDKFGVNRKSPSPTRTISSHKTYQDAVVAAVLAV